MQDSAASGVLLQEDDVRIQSLRIDFTAQHRNPLEHVVGAAGTDGSPGLVVTVLVWDRAWWPGKVESPARLCLLHWRPGGPVCALQKPNRQLRPVLPPVLAPRLCCLQGMYINDDDEEPHYLEVPFAPGFFVTRQVRAV